jgi:hypothetical protein
MAANAAEQTLDSLLIESTNMLDANTGGLRTEWPENQNA